MSDPVVALLQRRVLAWDYWQLYSSYGAEGRATEALRRPALTFASSEVPLFFLFVPSQFTGLSAIDQDHVVH